MRHRSTVASARRDSGPKVFGKRGAWGEKNLSTERFSPPKRHADIHLPSSATIRAEPGVSESVLTGRGFYHTVVVRVTDWSEGTAAFSKTVDVFRRI